MHKYIIRSAADVQQCLISFLALQRGILLQLAGAEPILDNLSVFTELRAALEVNQDVSPTHPVSRP